jgi:hypothetical protein
LWCLFRILRTTTTTSKLIQSFGWLLSEADVVTLYLSQGTNDGLKQKLEKELKPGARVVSHVFTFQGWRPLNVDSKSQICLYKIGITETPLSACMRIIASFFDDHYSY